MAGRIEMGTVSSRGQICIPHSIRENLGLKDGSKVLFVLSNDTLLVKKVNMQTFREITAPLKDAAKKAGMKESEVPELVRKARKARNKK